MKNPSLLLEHCVRSLDYSTCLFNVFDGNGLPLWACTFSNNHCCKVKQNISGCRAKPGAVPWITVEMLKTPGPRVPWSVCHVWRVSTLITWLVVHTLHCFNQLPTTTTLPSCYWSYTQHPTWSPSTQTDVVPFIHMDIRSKILLIPF